MRTTRLTLDRFKIVEHAELVLSPITLLIGGNNAGKSTVLHALTLLAQSVGNHQLQVGGPYLDLGTTPLSLLNRASKVGEGWSVAVAWEDTLPDSSPAVPVEVGFTARSSLGVPPFTTEGTVRFENSGGSKVNVRAWESGVGSRFEIDGHDVSQAVAPQGLLAAQPFGTLPTPAIAFDLGDVRPEAVATPYLRNQIAQALGSFRYVGDRYFSRSAYQLMQQPSAVPLQQDDLANALAYDRDVRRAVDERCREMFGFGVSADFAQGRNVDLVAVSKEGESFSVNQMGAGFGQVAWIAVFMELQLRTVLQDDASHVPLIGIEEPEVHLHPAAQPHVARMLASYARNGVQQLLTTQSEHFLIALLHLVSLGELNPSDLAVYHLDAGVVEQLEVDDRGRLSGGLKGFFEANEGELLAHLEALIRS
jgi:hypothetical protein